MLPIAGEHARNPGHISCVENELGLREWLEKRNCEFVVTAGPLALTLGPCFFLQVTRL